MYFLGFDIIFCFSCWRLCLWHVDLRFLKSKHRPFYKPRVVIGCEWSPRLAWTNGRHPHPRTTKRNATFWRKALVWLNKLSLHLPHHNKLKIYVVYDNETAPFKKRFWFWPNAVTFHPSSCFAIHESFYGRNPTFQALLCKPVRSFHRHLSCRSLFFFNPDLLSKWKHRLSTDRHCYRL